jgi:hypothetical protein
MERIPKPTPKSMNKKVLRKCETAQPLENIGDFALFKRGLRNRWRSFGCPHLTNQAMFVDT